MVFKSPFPSSDANSFGDLEPSEPSFVHEDLDPSQEQPEHQHSSDQSDQTAVVVPSLVTLARAYMWDRLPAGYSIYNDQEDVELFDGEKQIWKPLNYESDPDPERPNYSRSDSISSSRTDAPNLDEDDPRITGIAQNEDDITAWRKSFEENEGYAPKREDEIKLYQIQCMLSLLALRRLYLFYFVTQPGQQKGIVCLDWEKPSYALVHQPTG